MSERPSSSVNFDELSRRLENDRTFFKNIPSGILTCPDAHILQFLEQEAHLLWKRAYCFGSQANMRALGQSYGVKTRIFTAIRRLKDSPLALEIHFTSASSESTGWHPIKRYQMSLSVFPIGSILASLHEYVKLPLIIHQARTTEVLRVAYETPVRPPWLCRLIEMLPRAGAWHTHRMIIENLDRIESEMQWLSDNRRTIGRMLWLNEDQ